METIKMVETIIGGLIIALLSFGGGTYYGKAKSDKRYVDAIETLHKQNDKQHKELTAKIDSLQNLPAKVDTVIVKVDKIVEKVDTLILSNKSIFDNTEIIKQDVKLIKEKILE